MTRKINISGIIFHVEPVGYEILRAYLDAWSQRNQSSKALWEEQAAEYLLQKLKGSNTVTTTGHVVGMNKILKEESFPSSDNPTSDTKWGYYVTQIAFGLW